jgi:uncharacterized protein with HEPN domain
VHDYSGLSLSRVWDMVERDLPAFRVAVMGMLEEVGVRTLPHASF